MQEIMAIFKILRECDGKPYDMIIQDVNQAYVDNIGLTREKVINQSASDIWP